MQTIEKFVEKPTIIQTSVSGNATIKIVFRRPNLSQIWPLSKHPIGSAIHEMLATEMQFHFVLFNRFLKQSKSILWSITYKAMTIERQLYESFHLDLHRSSCQLMMI